MPRRNGTANGMDNVRIELLTDGHDRSTFSCGIPSLDVFLRTQARQHAKRGISRTFVAVRGESKTVLAYVTIVASSVAFAELPPAVAKKLPRHPVPAILIARLAVDQAAQGMGLGGNLLMDGLKRSLEIADRIGVNCVHVHAIDNNAVRFYQRYGFEPLPEQAQHLFLPIETIRKAFAGESP